MRSVPYAVYVLTTRRRTVLYTGVANNLARRLAEHRNRRGSRFTKRYSLSRLVHAEWFWDIRAAIRREKQIKAGSRAAKIALIEETNPDWRDLAEDLGIVRGWDRT